MQEYYLSIIFGKRKGVLPKVVCAILRFVSWVYSGIVCLIRMAYEKGVLKSYDLGRPVISVGNITWGGVGKTPLVEWIGAACLEKGQKPVILMRGYMPSKGVAGSDEAILLQDAFDGKIPVIAQKDRVQGALKVPVDYAHDVFILDDGFQHWRVRRDLEIVVIDAMNPFGNKAVIPRGSLRESLKVLRKADVVVLSKCNLGEKNIPQITRVLNQYCPDVVVVKTNHSPQNFCDLRTQEVHDLELMNERGVVLVSGIGSPKGFQQSVEKLGIDVKEHLSFEDHHIYTVDDMKKTRRTLEEHHVSDVMITSKDAVKIKPLINILPLDARVLVLNIAISIQEGEEDLHHAISAVCNH